MVKRERVWGLQVKKDNRISFSCWEMSPTIAKDVKCYWNLFTHSCSFKCLILPQKPCCWMQQQLPVLQSCGGKKRGEQICRTRFPLVSGVRHVFSLFWCQSSSWGQNGRAQTSCCWNVLIAIKPHLKGDVGVAWFKASSRLAVRSHQQSRFQEKKGQKIDFCCNSSFYCVRCVWWVTNYN